MPGRRAAPAISRVWPGILTIWAADHRVGYVVDRFSYTPVYVMVGAMAPPAANLFLAIMCRIERVPAYTAA